MRMATHLSLTPVCTLAHPCLYAFGSVPRRRATMVWLQLWRTAWRSPSTRRIKKLRTLLTVRWSTRVNWYGHCTAPTSTPLHSLPLTPSPFHLDSITQQTGAGWVQAEPLAASRVAFLHEGMGIMQASTTHMKLVDVCLSKEHRIFGRGWVSCSSFSAVVARLDNATLTQLNENATYDSEYNRGLAMTRQLLGAHDSGINRIRTGEFSWCPNGPAASSPWCMCHVKNVGFTSAAEAEKAKPLVKKLERKRCAEKSMYQRGKKRVPVARDPKGGGGGKAAKKKK